MTTENAFNSIPYSTTQGNRTQAALLPDSVGLDQRSLPALISEIRSIAKRFPFRKEDGSIVGNWQEFLDENVLFFLIALQEFPTNELRQNIKKLEEEECKSELLSLIAHVNKWYKTSLRLNLSELVFELENAIENQLKNSLQNFVDDSIPVLHPIWKAQEFNSIQTLTSRDWVERFLDAILYWQNLSSKLFTPLRLVNLKVATKLPPGRT